MNGKNLAATSLIRASQQVVNPGKKVVIGPESPRPDDVITVHESNGVVQSIEIKCKCGETINVRCQYK